MRLMVSKYLSNVIPGWVQINRKFNRLVIRQEVNFLHQLVLVLLSIFLMLVLISLTREGISNTGLEDLFQRYSLWSTVIGTIWIAAGVMYTAPTEDLSPAQLHAHVIETFKTASRHCAIGIGVILFGFGCQLVSGMDFIKKADKKPHQYDCRVWLHKTNETGEAERIKCTVDLKSED